MRVRLRWDVFFVLEHEELRRARDIEHYRLARQLGRTIVTLDRDYVDEIDGCHYLPIGVVGRLPGKGVLIELPHEADSGANRLWVREEQLRRVTVNA